MDILTTTLSEFLSRHKARRIWVALSGGLDSRVLLHLVAQLRDTFPVELRAVHVNHGMNPEAGAWEMFCQKIALQDGAVYHAETLGFAGAAPAGDIENILRTARYAVFSRLLCSAEDVLLTAHHQDDQAETVLLQLLRGAGPGGLAAMPVSKKLGAGLHLRPFLGFSRAMLQDYAARHSLQWVEDASNGDTRFSRNFIRMNVLPVLAQRWPAVRQTLARAAENCAGVVDLLEATVQEHMLECAGTLPHTLSVCKLRKLPRQLQCQVLRSFIVAANFMLPSQKKLWQIVTDVLHALPDRKPHVEFGSAVIRRYRDDLYLMRQLPAHDPRQVFAWDGVAPLVMPGIGVLPPLADAPFAGMTVRFRQGGEVCQLPGRVGHHALKKIFQERGIPPWLRARIPLIFVGDMLKEIVFSVA